MSGGGDGDTNDVEIGLAICGWVSESEMWVSEGGVVVQDVVLVWLRGFRSVWLVVWLGSVLSNTYCIHFTARLPDRVVVGFIESRLCLRCEVYLCVCTR